MQRGGPTSRCNWFNGRGSVARLTVRREVGRSSAQKLVHPHGQRCAYGQVMTAAVPAVVNIGVFPSFRGPDLDSGGRAQGNRYLAGHRRRPHKLPYRLPRPPTPTSRPRPNGQAPPSTADTDPEAATGSSSPRCSCPRSLQHGPAPAPTTTDVEPAGRPTPRSLLLGHHRINVLLAMLSDSTFYEPRTSRHA